MSVVEDFSARTLGIRLQRFDVFPLHSKLHVGLPGRLGFMIKFREVGRLPESIEFGSGSVRFLVTRNAIGKASPTEFESSKELDDPRKTPSTQYNRSMW